jgi:hypothetical protein
MRTVQLAVIGVLTATALVSTAQADPGGVYDVKFDEVTTNCASPLKYPHGKLTIVIKGNQITVDIDRTPLMSGIPAKNGKISAKSRLGTTMVEGMSGVFSVAGKVTPEGQLSLVMVGEYTSNGKPLCTQSWNITGPRADAQPKPKKSSGGSARVDRTQGHPVVRDLEHLARIGR